jgi:hypothetical protein
MDFELLTKGVTFKVIFLVPGRNIIRLQGQAKVLKESKT